MKRIIITVIAFFGISAATFAQAATPAKDTKSPAVVKHTAIKAKPAATTAKADVAKTATATKAVTPVAKSTATPVKHDGTPDQRYKANKDAAKAKKTHLKSDGTPDKRFKDNKPQ